MTVPSANKIHQNKMRSCKIHIFQHLPNKAMPGINLTKKPISSQKMTCVTFALHKERVLITDMLLGTRDVKKKRKIKVYYEGMKKIRGVMGAEV